MYPLTRQELKLLCEKKADNPNLANFINFNKLYLICNICLNTHYTFNSSVLCPKLEKIFSCKARPKVLRVDLNEYKTLITDRNMYKSTNS